MPASTVAAPSSMATWVSWPQACMTGRVRPSHWAVTLEANGRPVFSSTGRASMSARRATTLPGLPPFSTPTTPVRPTPSRTSKPRARSSLATRAAVRTSWLPSSGCSWMSRRQATTLGWTALAAACTWAVEGAASAGAPTSRRRPEPAPKPLRTWPSPILKSPAELGRSGAVAVKRGPAPKVGDSAQRVSGTVEPQSLGGPGQPLRRFRDDNGLRRCPYGRLARRESGLSSPPWTSRSTPNSTPATTATSAIPAPAC
jgi:hypothetical protein